MELIDKIPNLKDVEPLSFPYDITTDALREDIAEDSIPIEDLLANCDDHSENEVQVPKVVG